MNKRGKLLIMLVILGAGAGTTIIWLSTRSPVRGAAATPMSKDSYVDPLVSVNQKVRVAKTNDEKAVREMSDQIIGVLTPQIVPHFAKEKISAKLTRAEVSYRAGKAKGITEHDVVKMFDVLATKFSTPEYTKTSWMEVRTARIGLSAYMPDLISLTVSEVDLKSTKEDDQKKVLNPMSPAEAVAVSMHLLQQKMSNAAWQVSPQEFANDLHQAQVERWQKLRDQKLGDGQTAKADAEPKSKVRVKSNPKRDEVMRAIRASAVTMKPEELTGMADAALDVLGVK